MYSKTFRFWMFKRFLANYIFNGLWKVRFKIIQRKCSLGRAISNHWGQIHKKNRHMEFRLYLIVISNRQNSLVWETFWAIASSDVLHWRKAINSLNFRQSQWKCFIINLELPESRSREKIISWITSKIKNFQFSIRKIKLMIVHFFSAAY